MHELPIAQHRQALVDAVAEFPYLVVVGDTGSGKTTQLPQYLMENFPDSRIVVTQPRRIAAISAAKRVLQEQRQKSSSSYYSSSSSSGSSSVGYAVRFDKQYSKSTQLVYMTDGLLLRECTTTSSASSLLSNFDIFVLDEAHERSLETDILFGVLKRAMDRRRLYIEEKEKKSSDLSINVEAASSPPPQKGPASSSSLVSLKPMKVIIMSATLDVEKFSDFFGDCPIYSIPGRMFEVDIYWQKKMNLSALRSTYLSRAIQTALHIHKTSEEDDESNTSGDILVFLTGQNEIETACRAVKEDQREYLRENRKARELVAYPIYSTLETIEQRAIFDAAPRGTRKVIFATNIAQTSVTIPGIRYVVDCGFVKQKVYDPKTSMDALVIVPISQSAATQRAGRAGRTAAGKVYRLYSQDAFDNMDVDTLPEIQRASLISTLLSLKKMGIDDILGFDFIDPPDQNLVLGGLRQLWMLGALDAQGNLTEEVGGKMAEFPVSPFLSRAIIESSLTLSGCSAEMIVLASILSVEDLFVTPRGGERKQREAEDVWAKAGFHHKSGDHATLLRVYSMWLEAVNNNRDDDGRKWCRDHFLHHRNLKTARSIADQLTGIMKMLKLPIISCAENTRGGSRRLSSSSSSKEGDSGKRRRLAEVDVNIDLDYSSILKALCSGYYMNTAKRHPSKPFYHLYSILKFSGKSSTSSSSSSSTMSKAISFEAGTDAVTLFMSPQSVLHSHISDGTGSSRLDWILYHDVQFTNRPNMRIASTIQPSWVDPYFERIVKEAGDAAKMFDKLKQMGASGVDVEGEQKAIEAEIAASRYKNNGSPGCEAQGTEQQGESLMFNSGSFEVVHEEIDPLHHTERALLPDKADVDRKTKEAAARERYRNRKLKK